jgi:pantothenate kinase-related protein Tda10
VLWKKCLKHEGREDRIQKSEARIKEWSAGVMEGWSIGLKPVFKYFDPPLLQSPKDDSPR